MSLPSVSLVQVVMSKWGPAFSSPALMLEQPGCGRVGVGYFVLLLSRRPTGQDWIAYTPALTTGTLLADLTHAHFGYFFPGPLDLRALVLDQEWFCSPRGHLAMSGDIFGSHNWEVEKLLACSE